MYYVDVDIALRVPEETRAAKNQLSVQGPLRQELQALHIDSKILDEYGPAQCPLVRLFSSRVRLTAWLQQHGYAVFEIKHYAAESGRP